MKKIIHFLGNEARATSCKASPDFVDTATKWKKVNCVDCLARTPKPYVRKP